jgi:hypothetical protein
VSCAQIGEVGFFLRHDVFTVAEMARDGIKNGRLLKLTQDHRSEVFLIGDKNIATRQQLAGRPFAILIMTAVNWPIVRPHVAEISAAIDAALSGTVSIVECGQFVPSRLRKTGDPSV